MRFLAIVLVILTADPRAALAQSVGSALFRGDASASLGWFAGDRAEPGTCCGGWSSSLSKGAGGGYYWTDHLKSELDISWPGTTNSFTYPSSPPSTADSFIYDEHSYTTVKVSGSQLYQFGQNATVHPFVGIGVDVDRDRDDITRTTQLGRTFSQTQLTEYETHIRPFVTTGFKAYYSERAFFRTDVKVGLSNKVDQFTWRWGMGVDLGKSARARARAAASSRGQDAARQETPELWRAYTSKLKIGSTVDVATSGGERFVASLTAVDDTGIVVKPSGRVAEPARRVPFADLERLELHEGAGSANPVVAAAVGVAAGVGVFFLAAFLLFSTID